MPAATSPGRSRNAVGAAIAGGLDTARGLSKTRAIMSWVFQRNSSYLRSEKPNTVTLEFVCEKRTEPSGIPGGRLLRFCIPLRDLHVCVRVGGIREGVHT